MKVGRPSARLLAALVIGWLCSIVALPSSAQLPPEIEEQIQQFNSLPRAQQDALLRQLETWLPAGQRSALRQRLDQENRQAAQAGDGSTPSADSPASSGLPED